MARIYRARQRLRGSSTEDWILNALTMQDQPHEYEAGRRGGCRHCGLSNTAPVHGDATAGDNR